MGLIKCMIYKRLNKKFYRNYPVNTSLKEDLSTDPVRAGSQNQKYDAPNGSILLL